MFIDYWIIHYDDLFGYQWCKYFDQRMNDPLQQIESVIQCMTMNPSSAPKARPNQIADETIDELKDDIQKGRGEFSREQLARKFRGEALQKQTELEEKGIDTSELSDTEVIARHFEENLAFIPSYISIKELSDQGAAGLCNVVSNRVWLDEGILNLGMTRKKMSTINSTGCE